MSDPNLYRDEFIRTARDLIRSMKKDFVLWKDNPASIKRLNALFRASHSLKSGAAFLNMEELSANAQTIEEQIGESLKKNKISRLAIDRIIEAMDRLQTNVKKLDEDTDKSQDAPLKISPAVISQGTQYLTLTDQDRRVLTESWKMGETFYRLDAVIHPDEPMKFARAFLLNANLEAETTVIKTLPDLSNKTGDFTRITFFLTTDLPESALYKAVNIDNITRIDIEAHDYGPYLRDDAVLQVDAPEKPEDPGRQFFTVESAKVDDLKSCLEEMKAKVDMLNPTHIGVPELRSSVDKTLAVLERIMTVPVQSLLENFPDFVRRIAEKCGKQVQFESRSVSQEIDRSKINILSNILQHLVRNAIVHGIENPEIRKRLGKSPAGTVTAVIEEDKEGLVISVSDDGRGLELKRLQETAGRLNMPFRADEDLLGLISTPGFSTESNPDELSGRGAGLDLVQNLLRENLGGSLQMSNRPGQGLTFVLRLSGEKGERRRVLIYKRNREVYCTPTENIEQRLVYSAQAVRRDKKSGYCYWQFKGNWIPLYDASQPVYGSPPESSLVFILRHAGRRGAVICDDFIVEKDIPVSRIHNSTRTDPYLYRLRAVKGKKGMLYLSPSLLG